jgi:hypothetical protein
MTRRTATKSVLSVVLLIEVAKKKLKLGAKVCFVLLDSRKLTLLLPLPSHLGFLVD